VRTSVCSPGANGIERDAIAASRVARVTACCPAQASDVT
jgi:hypothetical protein